MIYILQEEYACVPLRISKPVVSYRETVSAETDRGSFFCLDLFLIDFLISSSLSQFTSRSQQTSTIESTALLLLSLMTLSVKLKKEKSVQMTILK